MERRQNRGRSVGAGIGAILGAVVFDGLLIFVPGSWSVVGMGAALGAVLGGTLGRR